MGDGVNLSGLGGGQQPTKQPTAEEIAQKNALLEQQLKEQQMLAEKERLKAAEFERKMKEGPQLTYNPIEETVGPDGKKTVALRKELQLESPEKFVQSERQRLAEQQRLGVSDLQGQIAQQQAQQQGRLAQYGLKGGNRALMGRYSMRDALMARQGLGRQFQTQAGELEAKGMQLGRETQAKNIEALGKAIGGVEAFNLEKWKKQKDVEASKAQAEATRAAGSGGKK
jgi:hypothetical protein